MTHAIFKALETSEMLLVSEYSFEMAFNTKYKSQDYDFFYEMVGAEDHIESVLNLHICVLCGLLVVEVLLLEDLDEHALWQNMRGNYIQSKICF